MTKKIKDDSDSDKKPKKKTKAKKKTTKKKDNKGVTINVNVGGGNNNKKGGKGGKGGFGGGVKSNRGFFSYASKDKNANKYNTTEPANIRPISYNSSLVSGHIDKNDAKDIEKLQNKLTIQDDNIIRGAESLKTLQNKLIKLENTPNKEIVYIQSPYNNNVPESAIKEVKVKGKVGRPRKSVIIEEIKEKQKPGPKPKVKTIIIKEDKVKKKPGPKPKVKINDDDNYQDIVVQPYNITSAIKEEKRKGRPKGVPNKPKTTTTAATTTITEVNQNLLPKFKDAINPVKDENIKSIKDQLLENIKPKNKPTKKFIKAILKEADTEKITKLLNEHGIKGLPDHLKKDKKKITDYIYNIANNPDVPVSTIKFYETPTTKGEEMFNEYFSEKLQKQEENEAKQINSEYKSRKQMRKEAKEAKESAKKEKQVTFDLKDPQESLSNTGVNMGGGGSILENLLNIVAPYTPEYDSEKGITIYG